MQSMALHVYKQYSAIDTDTIAKDCIVNRRGSGRLVETISKSGTEPFEHH